MIHYSLSDSSTYLACFGLGPSAAASAWSASELPWTSLAPTAAFLEALLGSDGAAHAALPTVVGSARNVAGSTIGIRARGHPCLRPCANTCRRSLPSGSCPGWTGGSEGFRSCQHSVAASARANCLHLVGLWRTFLGATRRSAVKQHG